MRRLIEMGRFLIEKRTLMLRILTVSALLLTTRELSVSQAEYKRVCRRYERNTGWWENVKQRSDVRFKRALRVSRPTFNLLLSKLERLLAKDVTAEAPIPPDERLAIALFKFSRGDYNYTLSELTGHGRSTVESSILEVIINNYIILCL